MKTPATTPQTIDDYIAGFPEDIQEILQKIRSTVRAAAPDAVEAIKYQMPTFVLHGNLVHFAAYQAHIGFYPTPSVQAPFAKELAPYERSKGTVRFSLGKPIPYELISKIVKFRVQENLERAAAKSKSKKGTKR